jgi:hypothetical protein
MLGHVGHLTTLTKIFKVFTQDKKTETLVERAGKG